MEYRALFSDTYLEHHGILGMKWGQRNGPPYPLDAKDHSASEKKAGWQKSLSGTEADTRRSNNRIVSKARSVKKHYVDQYDEYQERISRIKGMSDEELEKRIKRLSNEKKLKELELSDMSEAAVLVGDVLKSSGKTALTKVGGATGTYALKKGIEKVAGKETADKIDKYIKKK